MGQPSPVRLRVPGKLGYPSCAGGSKFVQIIGWTNGIMYWSNTEHRLMIADFNVSSSTVATDTSGEDIQSDYPTDLECLASGVNSTGGTNIRMVPVRVAVQG